MTGTSSNLRRRRIVLVGGPLDGQRLPQCTRKGAPWPPYQCGRRGGGCWQHYVKARRGRYQHRGLCDDALHGEHGHPAEMWRDVRLDRCCCGEPGCDGTGPAPWDR